MRNYFTKTLLSLFAISAFCNLSFGQAINSISPNHALAGETLTTTITISGITFTPGSPMGGSDIWLQDSNNDIIYSNFGSASLVDSNHVQVSWSIPNYATPGVYNLEMDALKLGNFYTYVLSSAFDICNLSVSNTFTNTTCGNSNGAINVTINSGEPPYSYKWNNGATTQNLTSLAQGVYTVTVTDANCTATDTIDIGNTNGVSMSDTFVPAICTEANGSVNLTLSGGTPPYTFAWSNGATTQNLSNVIAGSYKLTITDHTNCENFFTVELPDSNELTVIGREGRYSCNYNTGSIFTTVTGTPPYSYKWSNGSTVDSIINVPSGDYTVTVTDALGCSTVNTTFTNSVFNYYVYLSVSSPNCGSNGSITAEPSGGVPPYSYLWNNGQTAQIDTGLTDGAYSVTVTDSVGCVRYANNYLNYYCNNYITGKIFEDKDGNCIFDSSDIGLSGLTVLATNGPQFYYGYTDNNGNFSIQVGVNGTFDLQIYTPFNGICGNIQLCGSTANQIIFNSLGDTSSGNNFGFTASGGFDLALHPGWNPSKPGFPKEYWILYYNNSPVPFTDTATAAYFKYDSLLIYDSSMAPLPVRDSIARTLTWKVTNPTYACCYPAWNYRLRNFFTVPASLPLGYELHSYYRITPVIGDCDTLNNSLDLYDVVTGSRDPNEKDVTPSGGITDADSVLTYTIHFQNTGTDTTNFIIVTDTLPPYLNPATVQNIASSRPYTSFAISGAGILTWTFNPIFLIDSATNAPLSKAFVTFSVKTTSKLPVGTHIDNKANVYFDYNNAVITNTVSSQLQYPSGVLNIGSSIKIYPNPTSDNVNIVLNQLCQNCTLSVTDVVGRELMNQPLNGMQTNIDLSGLASGVYYIRVSTAKETETAKVVKQ